MSAARRHDDIIGRATALHLFSSAFPFRRWAEAWLAEQKTLSPDPLFDELAGWDLAGALETLRDWTAEVPAGERVGEGLLLGQLTSDQLNDAETSLPYARLLAAAYLDQDSYLRPPSFDIKRGSSP